MEYMPTEHSGRTTQGSVVGGIVGSILDSD
jgi:hypothetical protein